LYAGIGPGDYTINGRDKVAVISKNRPEWTMLDLAVQQIGAVLIPIYPTVSEIDLEFILKDSDVKIIFVNDEILFEKTKAIRANLPRLKEVILLKKSSG
jgi:long-chain acyl-CoA synthetase